MTRRAARPRSPLPVQPAHLFRVLVEHGRDPVLIVGTDGIVRYATPALHRAFGHPAAQLCGTSLTDSGLIHAADIPRIAQAWAAPDAERRDLLVRLRHADGSWKDVEVEFQELQSDRLQGALVLTLRDVTQRRLADEALVHKALHDALTGLPNRSLFLDRLEQALARAKRDRRHVAVVFLDLDQFKVVNDSLGHEAGDLLLTETAHRLLGCVRGGDTVARFGGDEFAVMLEGVVDEAEAEATAERLAIALREPIELGGRQLTMCASMGIALSGGRHAGEEELLREADMAMYQAKNAGRNRHALFQPWMQQRADERLHLEADLRNALEREELRVHYQPIVRLVDGELIGFEALVRWHRPGVGLMPPASFVPFAEETGLIVPIGRWVLEQACGQLRRWHDDLPRARQLTIAVNLSVRQLQDPGLLGDLTRVLAETGVKPSSVTLEITESVLVHNVEATIELLHKLKSLGIQLAIDDFGTGYSSLSYLKRLPLDRLKIDGSFVAGLGQDGHDQAIVRGILELAGTLELTTTAEGIETDMQLGALQRLGGGSGQGFLFARPVPADEVPELLAGGWQAAAA